MAINMQEKMKSNQGFTLLEILVVLTIMGFLLAMLAPRLAGITDSAVGVVCDSNATRAIGMVAAYHEQTARFPTNLTNLVVQDGATGFAIPTVSDGDPGNGPETLAEEFNDRNRFKIHFLNTAEIDELRALGVVNVLNLNDYTASAILPADQRSVMAEQSMTAGIAVAMIGIGATDAGVDTFEAPGTERGWGDPVLVGRIILGMGPENGLITSGLVANAAHCPGGIRNTDNAVFNDYNIVLPRLDATVARAGADFMYGITGVSDAEPTVDGWQVVAVQYVDEPAVAYDHSTNTDNLKVRTFDLAGAMESWQYTVLCPEGHMFPADEFSWGIDFDGLTGIN